MSHTEVALHFHRCFPLPRLWDRVLQAFPKLGPKFSIWTNSWSNLDPMSLTNNSTSITVLKWQKEEIVVTFCNKLFTAKFPYSSQISSQLLARREWKVKKYAAKSTYSCRNNNACLTFEIKATGRNFIFTFHVTIVDILSFTLTFFATCTSTKKSIWLQADRRGAKLNSSELQYLLIEKDTALGMVGNK